MKEFPTLYVVDDDHDVLDAIETSLTARGFTVRSYASAEQLLHWVGPDSLGCVITDLHMPGIDGQRLQLQLSSAAPALTVIVMTGDVDVPTTVQLMSQGAVAVLEKPIDEDDLLSVIAIASQKSQEQYSRIHRRKQIDTLISTMTNEEREIAKGMIAGTPIKGIARRLHISTRTVDRRRQSIFAKLQVNSIGELAATCSDLLVDVCGSTTVRADQRDLPLIPDTHCSPPTGSPLLWTPETATEKSNGTAFR